MAFRSSPAVFLVLAVTAARAEGACTTAMKPHEIGPTEAQRLYDCIEPEIVAAFAGVEGIPGVPGYRDWPLVSTAPFRSITHGRMFIDHIVSPEAADRYRRWEKMRGSALPPGTILVKESFMVADDGRVAVGPLFLMEKAPAGEQEETLGWIYTELFPDGRYERTGMPDSTRMKWCHDCHGAVAHQDGVFFPPRRYRVE